MILRYKNYGKAGFIYNDRGRKPFSIIPDAIRSAVVTLYLNKYYDANFKHFTELLSKHENIKLCERQWKSDPHVREFLSHFDRKKLRLPFARILEAIRFTIHVKDTGVVGQAIY